MKKQKILIADDSDLVRDFIGTLLSDHGYDMETAVNGVDAILKTYEYVPDLIIMDVEMPIMKGYQACRFIKTHPQIADIPIIIHTTKDEDISKFWGYSTGADNYVTKNFDQSDHLLKIIGETLVEFKDRKPSVDLLKGLYSHEEVMTEVNDLLDKELFSASVIAELSKIATKISSPSETIEKVFSLLHRIAGFDIGGFYIDRKSEGLLITYEIAITNNMNKLFFQSIKPHLKNNISDLSKKKIRINRIKKGNIEDGAESSIFGTLWVKPVQSVSTKSNLLSLGSIRKNAFSEEQIETLDKIYIQAAILIQNAVLFNDIKKLEEKTRNIFEKYVPKEVIKNFLGADTESLLSGERRSVSILFSDIRSFTSLSEKMSPEMVVNLLNRYFSGMVSCITKNKGMIDKFIGDALLAVFGAPNQIPNSPYSAVISAIQMIKSLKDLNEENQKNDVLEIKMGIGIHFGEAIVGNIGSIEKMDYTVIGDAVNLASRLEGLTKYYGVDIIISEQVVEEIQSHSDMFRIVEIDTVRVKGKEKHTVIYTVFSKENLPETIETNINIFEQAYSLYRLGTFTEALDKFNELDDSLVIKSMYLMRCREFIETMPQNWDGVFNLDTK